MRQVLVVAAAFLVRAGPCVSAESASVQMDEAVAVYGPGIFPAIKRMEVCGAFRAMVVYWAGTDMLFVDEIAPSNNESTMAVTRGYSIREFNHYENSIDIRELSCRLTREVLNITGKARDGQESVTYNFHIVMDRNTGKYTYSDARRRVE